MPMGQVVAFGGPVRVRLVKSLFLGLAAALAIACFAAAPVASAQDTPRAYLGQLVGCWRLDGEMGGAPLAQNVEARWALGGQFIEMRFVQADAPAAWRSRYEALYLIGYDDRAHRYVLNLFDSFGVASAPVAGLGVREGNSIAFAFPYADGDFRNTFTWRPEAREWDMILERRAPAGQFVLFARKRLRRC